MVSVREKENAPVAVSVQHHRQPTRRCHPPREPAALEDRSVQLSLQLPPTLDVPCVVCFIFGFEIGHLREDSLHHRRI